MNENPEKKSVADTLKAGLDWLLSRKEIAIGLAVLLLVVIGVSVWKLSGSPTSETQVTNNNDTSQSPVGNQDSPAATAPASEPASQTAVASAFNHTIYVPVLFTKPLATDPTTAAVQGVEGVVEIQQADGSWTAVGKDATLKAGQRIRTGALSGATLTFYDNSQATLYANSELSIDELNAQLPENGFRTVVMTQWLGESDHEVAFRGDGGSRYEVKTPSGSGIARGTKFKVVVTPSLLARYAVLDGKVDVTGLNKTVSVIAGQITIILAGQIPTEPYFRVTGEGQVSQIGAQWTIAGQTFQTDGNTLILGNPQVGDIVHIEGHLLPDGTRVADTIVLLQTGAANNFTLTGEVSEITPLAWTVAGQSLVINDNTDIDGEIEVGSNVRVTGTILPGGSLVARTITLLEDEGMPFNFTGVVESIGAAAWTVSGRSVFVDAETAVEAGIVVGDVVQVRGIITEEGLWQAHSIKKEDNAPNFSLTGPVTSMEPWLVNGVGFETREWTEIGDNIAVGDVVHVEGTILADGTWVANTIARVSDLPHNTIVIVGLVSSINPWIINGLPLSVTGSTVILGDVTLGSMVTAVIQLQADGTWVVISIRAIHTHFGLGCLTLYSQVVSADATQIALNNWPVLVLDGKLKFKGDLKKDSIVILPICALFNGTVIIWGDIIVIYQPVIIIIAPQPGTTGNSNGHGHKNK